MAVLDRFLQVMLDKSAEALVLEAGHPIALEIHGKRRPITKDPVNASQILALLREITPGEMRPQLEGSEGRVAFGYDWSSHPVDVHTDRAGGVMTVVLSPARPRRSTAAVSVPAEALLMAEAAAAAVAPSPPLVEGAPSGAEDTNGDSEERIQHLLQVLVERGSSDLHLRVGLSPTYRTGGELQPLEGADLLRPDDIEQLLLAIMPDRNKREFAETGDTDFAYEMVDVARFRVNAFRDRLGPGAVFRLIPTEIRTADDLGLPAQVQELCQLSKGLVLVTGPTGSGKSTTLAAMIDLVNRTRAEHIITIEDPIEFVHANKKCVVTQRQVGSHTQSFKRALRAALREDPDVILIGEMRDLETVAIALETAETGHLVFGTLHTTTAASTIDRIIDQFPADRQEQIRVMLADSLKGVVAQVLVKKKDGGRVAAREVLITNTAVANLIREGKTFQIPTIIQTNKKLGMLSLNDSLIDMVNKGVVTAKEAYIKAADKDGFENLLGQQGLTLEHH